MFEETSDNVEWLAKILLQAQVGGSAEDIERVWKILGERPATMERMLASARALLGKIRERAEKP